MRLPAQALLAALALTGAASASSAPSLDEFRKHLAGGGTVDRVRRQLSHRAGLVNDDPPRRHRPIVLPGQQEQQYQHYQAQYTPEVAGEVRYAEPSISTDAASTSASQLRAPVVSGGYANTNLQGYAPSTRPSRPRAAPRPQPVNIKSPRPTTAAVKSAKPEFMADDRQWKSASGEREDMRETMKEKAREAAKQAAREAIREVEQGTTRDSTKTRKPAETSSAKPTSSSRVSLYEKLAAGLKATAEKSRQKVPLIPRSPASSATSRPKGQSRPAIARAPTGRPVAAAQTATTTAPALSASTAVKTQEETVQGGATNQPWEKREEQTVDRRATSGEDPTPQEQEKPFQPSPLDAWSHPPQQGHPYPQQGQQGPYQQGPHQEGPYQPQQEYWGEEAPEESWQIRPVPQRNAARPEIPSGRPAGGPFVAPQQTNIRNGHPSGIDRGSRPGPRPGSRPGPRPGPRPENTRPRPDNVRPRPENARPRPENIRPRPVAAAGDRVRPGPRPVAPERTGLPRDPSRPRPALTEGVHLASRPPFVEGGRPGSRPRRPPTTPKPSAGYFDTLLSWFRGSSDDEDEEKGVRPARPVSAPRPRPELAPPQYPGQPTEGDEFGPPPNQFIPTVGQLESRVDRFDETEPNRSGTPGGAEGLDWHMVEGSEKEPARNAPNILPQFRPNAPGGQMFPQALPPRRPQGERRPLGEGRPLQGERRPVQGQRRPIQGQKQRRPVTDTRRPIQGEDQRRPPQAERRPPQVQRRPPVEEREEQTLRRPAPGAGPQRRPRPDSQRRPSSAKPQRRPKPGSKPPRRPQITSEPPRRGGPQRRPRPGSEPPRIPPLDTNEVQRRRGEPSPALPGSRVSTLQMLHPSLSKPSVLQPLRPGPPTGGVVRPNAPPRRRLRPPRPSPHQLPPPLRRQPGPMSLLPGPPPPATGAGPADGVRRPTVRPATLLDERRVMVVGPFGQPPPGAPILARPPPAVPQGVRAPEESVRRTGQDTVMTKQDIRTGGQDGGGITPEQDDEVVRLLQQAPSASTVADIQAVAAAVPVPEDTVPETGLPFSAEDDLLPLKETSTTQQDQNNAGKTVVKSKVGMMVKKQKPQTRPEPVEEYESGATQASPQPAPEPSQEPSTKPAPEYSPEPEPSAEPEPSPEPEPTPESESPTKPKPAPKPSQAVKQSQEPKPKPEQESKMEMETDPESKSTPSPRPTMGEDGTQFVYATDAESPILTQTFARRQDQGRIEEQETQEPEVVEPEPHPESHVEPEPEPEQETKPEPETKPEEQQKEKKHETKQDEQQPEKKVSQEMHKEHEEPEKQTTSTKQEQMNQELTEQAASQKPQQKQEQETRQQWTENREGPGHGEQSTGQFQEQEQYDEQYEQYPYEGQYTGQYGDQYGTEEQYEDQYGTEGQYGDQYGTEGQYGDQYGTEGQYGEPYQDQYYDQYEEQYGQYGEQYDGPYQDPYYENPYHAPYPGQEPYQEAGQETSQEAGQDVTQERVQERVGAQPERAIAARRVADAPPRRPQPQQQQQPWRVVGEADSSDSSKPRLTVSRRVISSRPTPLTTSTGASRPTTTASATRQPPPSTRQPPPSSVATRPPHFPTTRRPLVTTTDTPYDLVTAGHVFDSSRDVMTVEVTHKSSFAVSGAGGSGGAGGARPAKQGVGSVTSIDLGALGPDIRFDEPEVEYYRPPGERREGAEQREEKGRSPLEFTLPDLYKDFRPLLD